MEAGWLSGDDTGLSSESLWGSVSVLAVTFFPFSRWTLVCSSRRNNNNNNNDKKKKKKTKTTWLRPCVLQAVVQAKEFCFYYPV